MSNSLRRRRSLGLPVGARRGAAAVEFALTVVPFLVLLFGIVNYAMAAYAYCFVAYAAQRAARFAAINGGPSSRIDANQVASFVMAQCVGLDRKRLRVATDWSPDHRPGAEVQVRVEYEFGFAIPFIKLPVARLIGASEMPILN